jgi:thiol-disulfide isomerase/thioredoxin
MRSLLWLAVLLANSAYAQTVTIRGSVNNTDQQYRILLAHYDASEIDTTLTKNGEFSFTRTLKYPTLLLLAVENQDEEEVTGGWVFVEKGEVIVNLDVSKFYGNHTFNLTHPNSHNLCKSFYKRFDPLKKLYNQYIGLSLNSKLPESEQKIYKTFIQNILLAEEKVSEEFVVENRSNVVGAYIFAKHMRHTRVSKQDSIYKLFDTPIQNSKYLKDMRTWIDSRLTLQKGNAVPDVKGIGPDNKKVLLSDLKGKYVVLDFWGSWCAPCIVGFPKMKAYYQKYSDKVEFLGIACKDERNAWIKAIEKHELPWKHILNDSNLDLTNKFAIKGFPTKVLIDQQGNLVHVFNGEGDDFYEALDKLFQ